MKVEEIKAKAIRMRTEGWSYAIIQNKLGVSKSTLSNWLGKLPYTPNEEVLARMKNGPAKSILVRSQRKMQRIQDAQEKARIELGQVSARDLFLLGIGIYIGEGTKAYEDVRIINADPRVIALAKEWFHKVCGVPVSHFSVRLHIYPDIEEQEAKSYWSKIIGIPLEQFTKSQIDLRIDKTKKRKSKLPYGTAHLAVRSCGRPEYGVNLHRRIMAWIEQCHEQFAGIV